MAHIFIIHGVEGHPEENWLPWLRKEAEKLGHTVTVPHFPTPKNQTLAHWLSVIEEYSEFLTPATVLIGHSLGVPFILNILEKYPAKAAVLVAGFVGKAGNHFDEGMATFAQKPFDWERIKNNCQNFTVFHSDNDPYIKPEKGREVAAQLGVELTLVKGAAHFNKAAGYETFDLLLKKIKPFL
ncbi:hypothetical protein CO046_02680 [Candidatus Peregrinibacteria bacterium CG_4_9_14_0_2_um_filter_53_11]|nr:MAG: hypothetical protein CO046_02680 [Candidatus Peregrinibacteria bacterium CG_4_9_14_0_2_um_filter_53_11]